MFLSPSRLHTILMLTNAVLAGIALQQSNVTVAAGYAIIAAAYFCLARIARASPPGLGQMVGGQSNTTCPLPPTRAASTTALVNGSEGEARGARHGE
jgi:hypothetical protein